MKATVRDASNVRVVDLKGKMTLGGGDVVVRDVVSNLLKEGHKQIVLNLSKVDYIDSAGIGELVASIKLAERFGSNVKLLHVHGQIRDILELSQILPLLEIYESQGRRNAAGHVLGQRQTEMGRT